MSKQKQFFKGKTVRICWEHCLTVKVPPGKSPQEIWEEIDLGDLNNEEITNHHITHEFIEKTAYFYDDETNEQIIPEEVI